MPSPKPDPVIVLIPVHDDWLALGQLLPLLGQAMSRSNRDCQVLVVDDGSILAMPPELGARPLAGIRRIDVLRLRRNLGHQRAIAVGLCFAQEEMPAHTLVVMDGDGEDDPFDVPRLLDRLESASAPVCVFAERRRRAEGPLFRGFYWLYRLAHRVLTGLPVRIGNFSALPRILARRLTTASDLWNHYAATVVKSRLPIATIPTRRGKRLAGESRMNFVGLVAHGLSAISVFSDRVGVRLLLGTTIASLALLVLVVAAVMVRVATPLAIPGWATSTVGLLCVLLVQAIILSFVFVFMVLSGREASSFLPARDYRFFVEGLTPLWPKSDTSTPDPNSSFSHPLRAGSRTSGDG